MKKTTKEGIYTRIKNNGSLVYIITYRKDGHFYKKTLGTKEEGWTLSKAAKERLSRIIEEKDPEDTGEIWSLTTAANEYLLSISHKADYKNILSKYNNHIKEYLSHKTLDKITVNDVQNLKQTLRR